MLKKISTPTTDPENQFEPSHALTDVAAVSSEQQQQAVVAASLRSMLLLRLAADDAMEPSEKLSADASMRGDEPSQVVAGIPVSNPFFSCRGTHA
ncbi:hypothetical protein MTO96_026010 [Rhipicephalus appendiculatus]